MTRLLLDWYKVHKRHLPWNETHDPYAIWVSEIILQQTQVKQGLQYYHHFLNKFPNVLSLAQAHESEVLKAWEGLGYYSRARNLQKGARYVMQNFDGRLPQTRKELQQIPGIGPYTSSAIAAFAFGQKEAAIDGNLLRVITRLKAFSGDVHKVKTRNQVEGMALELMGQADPADFNRAMMDLGSSICKSKNPNCSSCPVNEYCSAYEAGQVEEFPYSSKKIKRRSRFLHYMLDRESDGKLKVYRRGQGDIWTGLYELPMIERETEGTIDEWDEASVKVEAIGQTVHQLTHQQLHIYFYSPQNVNITREVIRQTLEKHAFPVPIKRFLQKLVDTSAQGHTGQKGS